MRKSDSTTTIQELKDSYKKFCDDRNWKDYNIRDVILSIMIELGELAEHFQWDGAARVYSTDDKDMNEIKQEYADVVNYVLRLGLELDADITTEVLKKLEHHKAKYPKEKFTGKIKEDAKTVYKIKGKCK